MSYDVFHAYLMNKARSSGDISYLASPVTGGGIAIGRFQQLFLLAKNQRCGKGSGHALTHLV